MEGSKVLRGVFFALACAILMSAFARFFFGRNGWEGVLFYASRQIEHPIAKYYYTYCYLPNVHMEDSVDLSLGAGFNSSFFEVESDLSSSSSDNVTFNGNFNHYSTDWY